ncbi:multidrug efflux MFS transporter periplasmic adaptor subunit EmrA [Xenorhabdus szentirmaii]|uniref:Multidrug resistance protein A n=2 Tax=Xenorhabdus szentirmaii TaxID=290112 RepID=W1J6J6_9GAMM|nr:MULTISPECIES: multidrug efflux MFS transporter periplasmic adaptor subunit EmrA [Xenorhabdus]MBD2780743.1 multidrug efflux MFS transporter periplasmic adaptor subunit EmrA [Xenorhabdus sp. 38]MBD2791889.1 multidrug efflux MFS transporter periplasmic adaptor subunit EmrA [Xenorhabdus sp. CUL]MBD2800612.1 multidrug efflux MFS transporter periplasmic adaptor subunit EmrA [Xenorhabdus sp. M]MBD2819659.1 multidrug efflux MFS transporter periplasmic adaptor subunit EmrA [Xenorhabdus sp. 42]MBD282
METDTVETTPVPQQGKNKKRKFILSIILLVILLTGGVYFFYWYTELRFYQSTDNAYVAGNQIQVMSQVHGSVKDIYADNTDFVQQGDLLLILDSTDAENAFEKSKNSLAQAVRQTQETILNNPKYLANVELKQLTLDKLIGDLARREKLGKARVIAVEDLEHARKAVEIAKADLKVAKQEYKINQALVMGTPLKKLPNIEKEISNLREAWLSLQRTKIYAPVSGYVSRRSVQVGARITQSAPLMVIIPADQMWVEANFKEVQFTDMRLGQPVSLVSDFYGDQVVYQGRIMGMDMGTGSAFSILPAQNATGNWIKVVQRLPVRIELDPQQLAHYPLRIGLSMHATVDTRKTAGTTLADKSQQRAIYQTHVFSLDNNEIDQIIEQIIKRNTGNTD